MESKVIEAIWDRTNLYNINYNFKSLDEKVNGVRDNLKTLLEEGILNSEQFSELEFIIHDLVRKDQLSVGDINYNLGKIQLGHLSEEVIQAIAGDANVNAVPADNSITTNKYANKSVTREKLSGPFSSGKRLFNADNLNNLTDEGVYFKFAGANPTGLPTELVGLECFLEVRSWYATSTVNYTIQRITSDSLLNKVFLRTVKGGETPGEFKTYDISGSDFELTKKDIPSIDLNSFIETGYHLGLSTNVYQNMPTEMEGLSFLLRVESFAGHQGFLIQTMYQTSGQIQNSYKRFIQVVPNSDNVVGEWFKDYSLLGSSGGSGGTAYDQSLNTTDNVRFASIKADSIEVGGELKTGTIATPPTGLVKGDMWLDTTDSNTHPILRVMS